MEASISETPKEPMQVAREFQEKCRELKDAEAEVARIKEDIKPLHAQMLDLIENEKLPQSFRGPLGGNIHQSSQLWASPKDGNHARLAEVLESLGLTEYLPKTVNSQSISAYVREFRDEMGNIVIAENEGDPGLPKALADVLNMTEKFAVKAN